MRLPNFYSIENISLEVKEYSVDILIDNLNGIEIYESLERKGMTARLSFLDTYFFEEILPIVGGEKVKISLLDARKDQFNYTFIVSRKLGVTQRDETNYYNVELHLIEEEYFNLLSKNYNYGIFNNTNIISDTIYKISEWALSKKQKLNKNKIIPKIIPNLYFPVFWKVDNCIDYLLEKSTNKQDSGFYFIYSRRNSEFKIVSMMELIKDNNERTKDRFSFNLFRKNSFNFIIKREIVESNSLISNINENTISSRMYNLDTETKKLNVETEDFEKFISDFNKKGSVLSKEAFAFDSENNTTFEYKPYLFKRSINTQRNNRISKKVGTDLKLEVEIDGRLELNIGDKIIIDHPSKIGESNSIYDGEWVVFNIDHTFKADSTYRQKLLLVKSFVKVIKGTERILGGI